MMVTQNICSITLNKILLQTTSRVFHEKKVYT